MAEQIQKQQITEEWNEFLKEEEDDLDKDLLYVDDLHKNKKGKKKKKLLDLESADQNLGSNSDRASVPYERQCMQRILERTKQAIKNLRKEVHYLENNQRYALNSVRLHRILLTGMKVPSYKDQMTKSERKRLEALLHY